MRPSNQRNILSDFPSLESSRGTPILDRRLFLRDLAAGGLTLSALSGWSRFAQGAEPALAPAAEPDYPPHEVTVISGGPNQRGATYGRTQKESIKRFLKQEIFVAFEGAPSTRDEMLRYADACLKELRGYSPAVVKEWEGMSEAAQIPIEELALLSSHEELWHRGVLPAMSHCTAVALGPPETRDGHTYVGQTWDWMPSVYGLSSLVLWERDEGPNVLCYGYPGLWAGAGMNSAGLALCWTTAGTSGVGKDSPKVGIPAYALIAHLLYQESLEAVVEEARRAKVAGWFTFVMADGKGNLLNLEGSPHRVVVETAKGQMTRVGYGSREMTATPAGQEVPGHPRCKKMAGLLTEKRGRLDATGLGEIFCDPHAEIRQPTSTLDTMIFDTTDRVLHITRGLGATGQWRRFGFDTPSPLAWRSLFDGTSLGGWRSSEFGGAGEVHVDEGKIMMDFGVALTGITWAGESLPRIDYEVSLEAQRVDGFDFFCGLTFPVGDDPCSLIVGGWGGPVVGLSSLDGKDASENETTRSIRFESKRWYAIRLRVVSGRIQAWIDDESVVDADTRGRRISIRPEVERSKPFGVSTWCTTAAIKDIRIRELRGA